MGGGVMRAAAKVAGSGIVNTALRGGLHVTPTSAEHSVMRVAAARSAASVGISVSNNGPSANNKVSWEMVDDWPFAGGVEEEVVGATAVSERGEPMARVLFDGVPNLDEAKEATSDLKDALDKVYLTSPNLAENVLSSLTNAEEIKDSIAFDVRATTVPKPAIKAFQLLNESTAVQSVVASLATDRNVWNAVMNNPACKEFIQFQKTNDEYEDQKNPRSTESSVKVEECFDVVQPKDSKKPISYYLQNVKTTVVNMVNKLSDFVVEMVNKSTDFIQGHFAAPSAENAKENAGSNYFEKTIGSSLLGLAMMVVMIVLLKRI